jgi:hypothetical protein
MIAFWIAAVPSGTTATIAITLGTSSDRCVIDVYRITGLKSTTATDTATANNDAASALTLTGLDVLSGGCIIAAANTGISTSFTWSGTAGLVEDSDHVTELTVSAASAKFAAAQTGLTATATAGGSSVIGLAAIALR